MNKKLGIGIVVVAIVVVSMFAGCVEDEEAPVSTPTPTPVVTSTPELTATPKAVFTPTSEDIKYLEWEINTTNTIKRYSKLLSKAAYEYDADTLESYSGGLEDYCLKKLKEIDYFTVSSELQPAREELKTTLLDLWIAGGYCKRGARNLDADELNNCAICLDEANLHLKKHNEILSGLNVKNYNQ